MHIVIAGSVSDGLRFVGPFDCQDDASRYAEEVKCENWEVCELKRKPPTFMPFTVADGELIPQTDLIRCGVMYPTYFTVKPEELAGKTIEEQQEYIKNQSAEYLETSSASCVIHECDREDLIE
jgi:hypothetical protein